MQQLLSTRPALTALQRELMQPVSTASVTPNKTAGSHTPGKNGSLSKNLKYLTENDHLLIMDRAKELIFMPGEVLIREGSPSKALYLIHSGTARVARGGMELARFGAGNVCGEMTLLEDSPASASVIATDRVLAAAITVEELQTIFLAFPHLASRFYRSIALTLSARLREASHKLGQKH